MKYASITPIIAGFLLMSFSLSTTADRGSFSLRQGVTLEEPGQKAIIAYNGHEEILILGTDVTASAPTKVLEWIPFPSEPTVSLAPKDCFRSLGHLLKKYAVSYPGSYPGRTRGFGAEGADEGVEVRFHQVLGAHDVTGVYLHDLTDFQEWMAEFLRTKGLPERPLSPPEADLIRDYLERGFRFMVFDVVDVGPEVSSITPILYQFATTHFYYPLQTSHLFGGGGEIQLFAFTDQATRHAQPWVENPPSSSDNDNFSVFRQWGASTTAIITPAEMHRIAPELPHLFEHEALLQVFHYRGTLNFPEDIWLTSPPYRWPAIAPPIYIGGGYSRIIEKLERLTPSEDITVEAGVEKDLYAFGDDLELRFRVSHPGYIHIMHISSNGIISFLGPLAGSLRAVQAETTYSTVFDYNLPLRVTPPAGPELFNVFYTQTPFSFFDDHTANDDEPLYVIMPGDEERLAALVKNLEHLEHVVWSGTSVSYTIVPERPRPVWGKKGGLLPPIGTPGRFFPPIGRTGTTRKSEDPRP